MSSFLVVEVAVAEEEAPPPPPGEGLIGEVGSLSSMSESGDFGPPGIPPGWGVPPLEVVLRFCGDLTLGSAYLQLCTYFCMFFKSLILFVFLNPFSHLSHLMS